MAIVLNGTTGVTTPGIDVASGNADLTTLSVAGNEISAVNSLGFRNRIINGDMRIDQRNAGASVTVPASPTVFGVDRTFAAASQASKFTVQRNAGAVTPPAGFSNYLGATSSSAYSVLTADYFFLAQPIEGFNTADLGWGTANAQSVTISFWVRSSLTGIFGGSIRNGAGNRSYPFTFTISAANTWEQKTVTVAGDTSGTWSTDNSTGMIVGFGLGVGATYSGAAGSWAGANYIGATGATSVVGTNGAAFYITGVQLEAGSVASPFERRDYGRELMMCQRYFEKSYNVAVVPGTVAGSMFWVGIQAASQYASIAGIFAVSKRAAPTLVIYNPTTGATGSMSADGIVISAVGSASETGLYLRSNNVTTTINQFLSGHWTASAEL
jgi:hypothetical protein